MRRRQASLSCAAGNGPLHPDRWSYTACASSRCGVSAPVRCCQVHGCHNMAMSRHADRAVAVSFPRSTSSDPSWSPSRPSPRASSPLRCTQRRRWHGPLSLQARGVARCSPHACPSKGALACCNLSTRTRTNHNNLTDSDLESACTETPQMSRAPRTRRHGQSSSHAVAIRLTAHVSLPRACTSRK